MFSMIRLMSSLVFNKYLSSLPTVLHAYVTSNFHKICMVIGHVGWGDRVAKTFTSKSQLTTKILLSYIMETLKAAVKYEFERHL